MSIQLPVHGVVDAPDIDAMLRRGEPLVLLDVRTPAEFAAAHIPGSYNVPLDLLPEHATEIGTAIGAPVVLVCRSGARARQAERSLPESAFPRLHVLNGGLAAWEAAGLSLNRGPQRWGMERQVRGVAGALVLAGALGGLLVSRPLGLLAAGVGAGLAFSAVTDTCGMAKLLSLLPYNQGASCDVSAVLRQMNERQPAADVVAVA